MTGWKFNARHNRFELYVGGQVVAVDVLPGGSEEGLSAGIRRGAAPGDVRAVAQRMQAGDPNAEAELEALLERENSVVATAPPAQGGTQTGTQAQGTPQGQGAVSPTAEYLSAGVQILRNSANMLDAQQKLANREQEVARAYQAYGRPMPDLKALGQQASAQAGALPVTPAAIRDAAARDPDFLRIYGDLANLPLIIDTNTKVNALDAAAKEITNYADWDTAVAEYDALLAQREQAAVDMDQDAAAELAGTKNEDYARVQQAGWRRKAQTLAALDAKLTTLLRQFNRHPESAKWFEERNLAQARAGTLRAGSVYRDTIGREIPNERLPYEQQRKPVRAPGEPDPGPPAWTRNVPPGASPDLTVFGTPEQHGQTVAPPAPSYTAPSKPAAAASAQPVAPPVPVAPSADQPPRPAAAGMKWEKRGTEWVEVPDTAQQPPEASLPAFAFGGTFGGLGGGGSPFGGGGEGVRPPPSNRAQPTGPQNPVGPGQMSRSTGYAPGRARRPGEPMDRPEAARALLMQQYEQARAQLQARHMQRMAAFSTDARLRLAGTNPPPYAPAPPV